MCESDVPQRSLATKSLGRRLHSRSLHTLLRGRCWLGYVRAVLCHEARVPDAVASTNPPALERFDIRVRQRDYVSDARFADHVRGTGGVMRAQQGASAGHPSATHGCASRRPVADCCKIHTRGSVSGLCRLGMLYSSCAAPAEWANLHVVRARQDNTRQDLNGRRRGPSACASGAGGAHGRCVL